MELIEYLSIRPGVTAVIGGGGKTTLLETLGKALAGKSRVLLCTTTRIFPFPGIPCARSRAELERLRRSERLVCAGERVPGGEKLMIPEIPMAELAQWFDYVLVEADGAARRPLKAHAPHEPAIPAEADQAICVVGSSGFGKPIEQAVHRPALYAALAGVSESDMASPETEAAVLSAEALHHRVFINQVETAADKANAAALAAKLNCPVLAGSLWKGMYFECAL